MNRAAPRVRVVEWQQSAFIARLAFLPPTPDNAESHQYSLPTVSESSVMEIPMTRQADADAWRAEHRLDVIVAPANDTRLQWWRDSAARSEVLRVALTPEGAQMDVECELVLTPDMLYSKTLALPLTLMRRAARAEGALAVAQRELNAGEILKSMISSRFAHEVRTPLYHLQAAISLLDRYRVPTGDQPDRYSELIAMATGASERLETFAQRLSLINTGLRETLPCPVIPRDVVNSAIAGLRRQTLQRDQLGRVVLNIEDDLPPIFVDPNGISIVLQELLDNALKFSAKTVDISVTTVSPASVRFSVRDQGIGIAPEHHYKIYEPFFQVNQTANSIYNGAGVGLAISQIILDRHHIPIQLDSRVGIESIFTFEAAKAQLDRSN